jgi:hypothetical protein
MGDCDLKSAPFLLSFPIWLIDDRAVRNLGEDGFAKGLAVKDGDALLPLGTVLGPPSTMTVSCGLVVFFKDVRVAANMLSCFLCIEKFPKSDDRAAFTQLAAQRAFSAAASAFSLIV